MSEVKSNNKYNLHDGNFSIILLNLALYSKNISHVTQKTKDFILRNNKKLSKIEELRKFLTKGQYEKIESVFYIPQKNKDPQEIIKHLTEEVKELKFQNKLLLETVRKLSK